MEYLGLRCAFILIFASIQLYLYRANSNETWYNGFTQCHNRSGGKRMCFATLQKPIPPLLDFNFLAVRNMAEKQGAPSTEEQEMEEEKQNSEKEEESEEEESDDEEYFEVEKIISRKKRNVS